MPANPFWEYAEDSFRSEEVVVRTDIARYNGWVMRFNYQDGQILLADATVKPYDRSNPIDQGVAFIDDYQSIERIGRDGRVRSIPLDEITHSRYHSRRLGELDLEEYIRSVRDRGHLPSFPVVRPVEDRGESLYEIISGNKRLYVALRAGLEQIPVRIRDLDDFEALQRFVDLHFPLPGEEDGRDYYSADEVARALEKIEERWDSSQMNRIPALRYYT